MTATERRMADLEEGLREVLDKVLEGFVDSGTILRLRRLVGIETGEAIMLSEVQAAQRRSLDWHDPGDEDDLRHVLTMEVGK